MVLCKTALPIALVNEVADQVVECIKPMLLEIMQAITLARPQAAHMPVATWRKAWPIQKAKSRQMETDIEWSNQSDNHEETDLQEAILASMAAKYHKAQASNHPPFLHARNYYHAICYHLRQGQQRRQQHESS